MSRGIGALHPVNVDNREHSMRVLNLALMLADDAARDDVEEYCAIAEEGGVLWCDTSRAPPDMIHPQDQAYCRSRVSRALRYVDLRDTDVAPWIFHRHPERAHLVRFETRSFARECSGIPARITPAATPETLQSFHDACLKIGVEITDHHLRNSHGKPDAQGK